MKLSHVGFAVFGDSLSIVMAGVCTLWLAGSPSARGAGLVEPFAYSNGDITAVSGGLWKFWEPGAGNGSVVNGAFRFDGTTDVIRTFPSVLNAPGDFAIISFTITVNIANTSEGYAMDFLPASAPFGAANTNYGNQFSLGFDYNVNSPAGLASIDIAEGGAAQTVPAGFMTAGVAHLIRIDLARGAANTAYSLFVDNTLLHSGTIALTDARGMNAVELEQSGASSPSATGFAVVDNIAVVPEPASSSLLVLSGIAILATRWRPNASEKPNPQNPTRTHP